jgi:putative ABC transport system permease protein
MSWIASLLRRLGPDRELAEELEAHLEEKVADLVEAGVPEREARARARREFGNAIRYREKSRDVWGWVWLETLLQDARYGARMLARSPGFTAVATATLAIGIAVNSSIFSLTSAWLLKKPAVADPDRVVAVVSTNATRALERGRVSTADYLEWRGAGRVFADLEAMDPEATFSLTGAGEPERLAGMRVTASFFRMLGTPAFLGRTFLPDEDQPGRGGVVVLTFGLWQTHFGSDPNIIGRPIALDGEKYVVVGVMPAEFRQHVYLPRLWTPLVLQRASEAQGRDRRWLIPIGRLQAGVAVEEARAEVAGLARRAEQNHPAAEKGRGGNVMTLQEYGIQEDQVRPALALLTTAVALVLVIACANIANLLLARASKRRQEIAIRTALGAGRQRLIRQLLVESLLIGLAGGGAGLALATAAIPVLRSSLGFNEYVAAMAIEISLDHRVLVFTWVASMGAAMIFGLAPAIRVSAAQPQSVLRQGGRMGDLRRAWGRNLLVGSQIGLAVVLLTGAGLLIKATAEELGGDFGFDTKRVAVAGVSLTNARYREPARRTAFLQAAIGKLRAIPGVEAAGVANAVPFNAEQRSFSIQGREDAVKAERPKARYFAVSAGHFAVLNIPMLQGRGFLESDGAGSARVAIVNRVFAQRFFPGQNPLGSYIRIDHDGADWSEIVGIAGNVKTFYGPKEEDAQVYEPYLQVPPEREMWLAVRTAGREDVPASALRSAIASIDSDQPIARVQTVASTIDEQQGGDYVFDALLGIFGAVALLLAAIGIYGVVAYGVAQRTREIGIRVALGAHRGDVVRQVMGRGMLLAAVSAGLGMAAAAPLPRLFAAMLQGFRVHSTAIFLMAPLPLLLVVLAAIGVPAWRAAKVNPIEALRCD